jgi:hypothetical protein
LLADLRLVRKFSEQVDVLKGTGFSVVKGTGFSPYNNSTKSVGL